MSIDTHGTIELGCSTADQIKIGRSAHPIQLNGPTNINDTLNACTMNTLSINLAQTEALNFVCPGAVIGVDAPSATAAITYHLPASPPSSDGMLLACNRDGTMYWAAHW